MGAANSVGEMATNAAHAAKTAPDNIRGVIEAMTPEAKEQFRAMLTARCISSRSMLVRGARPRTRVARWLPNMASE